ncbi:STAS domain-containing protein [Streptomyces clavuligerus]|uniref:STAS domain-containing protein n=1 Tax=Streptomyces clavuligerus TaxID=1901 RepID=B5GT00_STRCL|nr:STAS domain-containing protein [Streptomyces clavuligerus]ANW18488.1 sulfate transporter [Streptomyces clavuligerus]AXU13044.1 STAS domain-containing protein [Streptomyces clavuligerus]EDY49446.1 hypothetical protein SSCG_02474 [Streptomyces clavuligerus]EFG08872.1 STAS domain-containing protein [Streptomyces clavuligerus]MBY6302980.1 STAS domain-containing protein [Streptomyces clavuligerus]
MNTDTPDITDPADPTVFVLVVPEGITLADVPPLCERLRALYADGAHSVVCDLGALERADLAAVEAVARLRLTARRAGRELRTRDTPPALRALLALAGLDTLIEPVEPGSTG